MLQQRGYQNRLWSLATCLWTLAHLLVSVAQHRCTVLLLKSESSYVTLESSLTSISFTFLNCQMGLGYLAFVSSKGELSLSHTHPNGHKC